MKVQSKAHSQSNADLLKSNASLKDKGAMSAAIEAKDKELENFREGQYFNAPYSPEQIQKENDSLYSDIEALSNNLLKTQEDLDMTTRNRSELEYEIQALRTTLRKNSAIMEIQRVDLGTYKSGFSRLESKYNDVVAAFDEVNGEIVERESGIENSTQANSDLRTQIDRLNGELAEAESAKTKAEAERDRIQLLFNDLTGSGQLLQRERDVNRAESERLRASEAAKTPR